MLCSNEAQDGGAPAATKELTKMALSHKGSHTHAHIKKDDDNRGWPPLPPRRIRIPFPHSLHVYFFVLLPFSELCLVTCTRVCQLPSFRFFLAISRSYTLSRCQQQLHLFMLQQLLLLLLLICSKTFKRNPSLCSFLPQIFCVNNQAKICCIKIIFGFFRKQNEISIKVSRVKAGRERQSEWSGIVCAPARVCSKICNYP